MFKDKHKVAGDINSLKLLVSPELVCSLRLLQILKCTQNAFTMEANTMNPDQAVPKGSSLIWVHIVCI